MGWEGRGGDGLRPTPLNTTPERKRGNANGDDLDKGRYWGWGDVLVVTSEAVGGFKNPLFEKRVFFGRGGGVIP